MANQLALGLLDQGAADFELYASDEVDSWLPRQPGIDVDPTLGLALESAAAAAPPPIMGAGTGASSSSASASTSTSTSASASASTSASAGTGAATQAASATSGKEELDAKAWLKRRRGQIAKASRKARQKRQQQVDELTAENDSLRDERALFLGKIHSLQLKIDQLRSVGQIDVQLENDLLRAQLEEHKRFLSGCFRLHHGIPTPSSTLHKVHEQGSGFAQTFVQSLISHSITDGWARTKLRPEDFPEDGLLRPGYSFCVCHRFSQPPDPPELQCRIDITFPRAQAGMDAVAEAYWRFWTDGDLVRRLFNIEFAFQHKRLELPGPKNLKERIGAFCYHENREPADKDCEWVFLVSRERQQMVKSTLTLPDREMNPGIVRGLLPSAFAPCGARVVSDGASDGEDNDVDDDEEGGAAGAGDGDGDGDGHGHGHGDGEGGRKRRAATRAAKGKGKGRAASKTQKNRKKAKTAPKKKRKKKGDAVVGTFGRTPGWILARSTTEHIDNDDEVHTEAQAQAQQAQAQAQEEQAPSPGPTPTPTPTPAPAPAPASSPAPAPSPSHKRKSHRIKSLIIEGMVTWEQGVVKEDEDLDASFKDGLDADLLVEREMCTRLATVVSLPAKVGMAVCKTHHDVVDQEGFLTSRYAALCENFAKSCVLVQQHFDERQTSN